MKEGVVTALRDRWIRIHVSILLGLTTVAVLALLAKVVIEATTETLWVIHWFETVPFIALLFGYVINGAIRDRLATGG